MASRAMKFHRWPPVIDVGVCRGGDRHAILEDAVLHHAKLKGANLAQGNLERANLSDAKLDGANLQGVRMAGAIWTDGTTRCKGGSVGECVR